MRSFLVRKINNFTKTLSLRAKVPNTYGARLYIYSILYRAYLDYGECDYSGFYGECDCSECDPNPYLNSYPKPYPNPYSNPYPNPYSNPYPNPYPNPCPNPYPNSYPKPYPNSYPNPYPNP